jgi:hypothetical protein
MKGGDMYKPGDLLGAAYFVPEDEPGWVRAAARLPVQGSRRRPPRPPVVVLLRASRRERRASAFDNGQTACKADGRSALP